MQEEEERRLLRNRNSDMDFSQCNFHYYAKETLLLRSRGDVALDKAIDYLPRPLYSSNGTIKLHHSGNYPEDKQTLAIKFSPVAFRSTTIRWIILWHDCRVPFLLPSFWGIIRDLLQVCKKTTTTIHRSIFRSLRIPELTVALLPLPFYTVQGSLHETQSQDSTISMETQGYWRFMK